MRLNGTLSRFAALLLAGWVVATPSPTAQQSLTDRYASWALTAPELPVLSRLRCATVHPNLDGELPHVAARDPLPDGRPLRAKQVPALLRPTQNRSFGFNNFLVLGDYPTVTFERWDWDENNDTDRWRTETWRRVTTRAVAGRLVSVFQPRWSPRLLRRALRFNSWGVDRLTLYWGRVRVRGEHDGMNVFLNLAPSNIPASPVVRINSRVQYGSHVVNIRVPGFGDSRIQDGDATFNIAEVTREFYEHFVDRYETVAVVSDWHQFGNWGAFHRPVRNAVSGIGLDLFDRSAEYGSAGVLEGIEGYTGNGGGWADWGVVLHEQGHQYGDYTAAWRQLQPPLERHGHQPEGHTPLLFPGAVTYGAVLNADVRVQRVQDSGSRDRFEIASTMPIVRYHPLTLYRMGLVRPAALPRMLVFRRQGQFDRKNSSTPARGTAVTGARAAVTVNDLMAADGVRRGPVARRVRRAMVFVSRGALASKAQMDVLNYVARRMEASSGVTSWIRYPTFEGATGGRARMVTRIRPKRRQPAAVGRGSVRCAKVGTRALVGVVLDRAVGGCLRAGQTLRVSGRLTLRDRPDYNAVCLRFVRYPNARDADRIFECAELRGDRFALTATLPAAGGYQMQAFAFWPGSGGQYALSSYTGAIEVVGGR